LIAINDSLNTYYKKVRPRGFFFIQLDSKLRKQNIKIETKIGFKLPL